MQVWTRDARLTNISYQQVLGGVLAEYSVALEQCDGLSASVCDCNFSNVISRANNFNRKRASSHSCASKGCDWEDVGTHVDDEELWN